MQEHKQIADSFASEAPEYTFTMKLESEFIDNDDMLNQGYASIGSNIYANNSGNASDLIFSMNSNVVRDENGNRMGYEFSSSNRTTNERKSIIIDTIDGASHLAFFSFYHTRYFYYEEKIFLVTDTFRGSKGYSYIYIVNLVDQ